MKLEIKVDDLKLVEKVIFCKGHYNADVVTAHTRRVPGRVRHLFQPGYYLFNKSKLSINSKCVLLAVPEVSPLDNTFASINKVAIKILLWFIECLTGNDLPLSVLRKQALRIVEFTIIFCPPCLYAFLYSSFVSTYFSLGCIKNCLSQCFLLLTGRNPFPEY